MFIHFVFALLYLKFPFLINFAADGLPPKAPLRKRLTVSSYLSGSNFSLHRRLNSDYFNPNTDKSQQATDPLFWKPFSYKTNRVRSLTELYVRKNQSPSNSTPDHLDRRIDELNQIYCMPKRPPLPVRYKKRQLLQTHNKSQEPIYHRLSSNQLNSNNYLKPNQYTNLHEVYTVRDAIVGPNITSYGEKEIQTSLEDFQDLDYEDDEYENSPRFIDSSTNDEFESLAKTRNLSDNDQSERKIKKKLEKNLENLTVLNELKKQQEELRREIEEEIKQQEAFQTEKSNEQIQPLQLVGDERLIKEETIEQIIESEFNEEPTLNDECTYVTVQDTSTSKTIGPYLDAQQGSNTHTVNDDKKESTYVTLDYEQDPFDTDTLADLDSLADASLAGYATPMNGNSSSSLDKTIPKMRPKRTKRRSQLRNSGLDTEDDEDDVTDEIIGIAANIQANLKQLVDKQN